MYQFTEQGETHREVLAKIKAKYGESTTLLNHRTVKIGGFLGLFARDGVEITGYVSEDPPERAKAKRDIEDEKRRILESVRADQTLKEVLSEVRSLKETIESRPVQVAVERRDDADEHETVRRLGALLSANDFTEEAKAGLLSRVRAEFTLTELDDFRLVQDRVLEWIGESVSIYEETVAEPPRVIVLVGPTGVGKTTTIAKLAATYGIAPGGRKPLRVRMITIDNYRIGAKQQIETYGSIMQIPVSCVETFEDLRKTIALYREDADVILVDTIGKSPRDAVKLAEMKELLAAAGPRAEAHLALSASTKTSDMREILRQFEPFNYRSVAVTKFDETVRTGNVLSVLAECRKPVSWITDGQHVPQDIERATVLKFLMNLEGFEVNRARLEERFPESRHARINWR